MEETLEYWQKCLAEFQEALTSEMNADEINDEMIKLLKKEAEACNYKIQELQ